MAGSRKKKIIDLNLFKMFLSNKPWDKTEKEIRHIKIEYKSYIVWNYPKSRIFYIYKRLRPSKKIRNRKKKEQQKLFINEMEHQTSLI